MLYNTLHNRALRLGLAVAGELITAAGINLFIVPLGLYSGGTLGVCQLIRTFLQSQLGLDFGTYDIAGALYLITNIPILIFAWRVLGRGLAVRTIVCTAAYSVFASLIPVPAQPIVGDYLTACILGGILNGVGSGIVLTCGCSGGGLDAVGLCLGKLGRNVSVGRFSILFNAVLYTICLIVFNPEVAIYSVVYNFLTSIVLDRIAPAERHRPGPDLHPGGRERSCGLHHQAGGPQRHLLERRGCLHQGQCPRAVRMPVQIRD